MAQVVRVALVDPAVRSKWRYEQGQSRSEFKGRCSLMSYRRSVVRVPYTGRNQILPHSSIAAARLGITPGA